MENRFKFRCFGTRSISRRPIQEMLYITGFRINLDNSVKVYIQDSNSMLKTKTFKEYKYKLMQCTGLKDCNDTLIYADDIVENQYKAKRVVKRIKTGEYRLFCGQSSSNFTTDWKENIEFKVIGNIHQHSHLLENK